MSTIVAQAGFVSGAPSMAMETTIPRDFVFTNKSSGYENPRAAA
jgi:hypothetical protein